VTISIRIRNRWSGQWRPVRVSPLSMVGMLRRPPSLSSPGSARCRRPAG